MPSAANGKSEKPASSEATDNSPIRQIMVIIEHKIRNLEKRKSKLTSYRDLQKSGKELNADQKVAVAKYDEVVQTLEFARDLSKQVASVAITAERDAKKQAKKEAWVRNAAETSKIREVLLILDCLVQMGHSPAREDFLNGTNGAARLTQEDLKILDELYPEVTPKHEVNEEGQPGFPIHATKAAEHLYAIIDGKPKEILGTTYAHIKEIVVAVQQSGYFDKTAENEESVLEVYQQQTLIAPPEEQPVQELVEIEAPVEPMYAPPLPLPVRESVPVAPAPAVVPAPGYPLRPLPPITLQEVEHAYFTQQYPQQRPISEVIGSQNFFFLQESEIDSPVGTPQPLPIHNQPSPPGPIPSQTFTNQSFVPMAGARIAPDPAVLPIPQPHFAPPVEHPVYAAGPLPPRIAPALIPVERHATPLPPAVRPAPSEPAPPAEEPQDINHSAVDANEDEWTESPDREGSNDQPLAQGQGDGQGRFRRYGRGGPRGQSNGYRGRGGYQNRQNSDGYQSRQNNEGYQPRQNSEGYQNRQHNNGYHNRQNNDGYQNRSNDGYYRNGDNGNGQQQNDNNGGARDRYDNSQGYHQGGYKGRGRGGGTRGGPRGAPRAQRPPHYARKPTLNAE